jgi:hypothetical protein
MELVKLINKYLNSTYGQALDFKPKFRLVWSEDLTEVRKGIFSPLQVIETIEQVKKYTYFKDKWVLEVYTRAFPEQFGRALNHSEQSIMSGDYYEPIRVFQTRKGEYLPPNMEVCKILCDSFIELINRPEARRLTDKQANYNDTEQMRKETAKFFEMLSANDSDLLSTKFRNKEAVVLPGKEVS